MHIALTFDLKDDYLSRGFSELEVAEFDSLETIEMLEQALKALGHQVTRIGHIKQLVTALASGQTWDLVFNIAEGLYGAVREAQIPALLDAYQISYTFSDPKTMMVCQDKALAKEILIKQNIKTAPFVVVEMGQGYQGDLTCPLFVKPLFEGTSKGVNAHSRIENTQQLHKQIQYVHETFKQPALIESYLSGREFTVGLLGHGHNTQALGVLEVSTKSGTAADPGIHSYDNKQDCLTLMDYRIAHDAQAKQAAALAVKAWQILGCLDAGRVDIRFDAHEHANFLEANPLAGLHPRYSDLPIMANQMGMTYHDLIRRIVEQALKRTTEPQ
jgi:D-alanine-D-alanine ligase